MLESYFSLTCSSWMFVDFSCHMLAKLSSGPQMLCLGRNWNSACLVALVVKGMESLECKLVWVWNVS